MKKKFLLKIVVVFSVFIFSFLLQWKISFGRSDCRLNMQKAKLEKCFLPSPETNNNAYEIYPFDDFLIKI